MASVLLVTFAIGEKFIQQYNRLWRASQENYAKKHGYDFKVLETHFGESLDATKHIDANNRLLVCSQDWSSQYDFIIYIDADILININAPPIHLSCDFGDKIGIVDEFCQPRPDNRVELVNRRCGWEESAKEYYKLSGLDVETEQLLNSGVMVFQPKKHESFLKSIYDKYSNDLLTHPRSGHFNQAVIGYELMKNDNYVLMSTKWNCIWNHYKVYYGGCIGIDVVFNDNYFFHFAGNVDNEMAIYLQFTNGQP